LTLDIQAKKRFGQNFLKDERIKVEILETIPKDNLQIVEIGVGLGDLTEHLLKSNDVVGYEIDTDLCKFLKDKFQEEIEKGSFRLICGDVLEFWKKEKTLLENKEYKIVANLPYYIATNIILRAFDDLNCKSATVMVQKEVGDKFTANSGDKNYSSLSVLSKSVGSCQEVVFVPPNSFEPPPKVDSVVIQFERQNNYQIEEDFKKFLKVAFQQPRKTLIKNLSMRFNKKDVQAVFSEMEISNTIRPHQLDEVNYHQIYATLERFKVGKYGSSEKERKS
jgi:16S rRNA (adenine1518-N6/adenine1519-N6)-dimethyltransferase